MTTDSDAPSGEVPAIDIAGLRSGDLSATRDTVDVIGRACTDIGFFVITGHGLEEQVEAAFGAARDLFAADPETKRACSMVDDRGYAGIGSERAGAKEMYDQAVGATDRWPAVAGFREIVAPFQLSLLDLAFDVLGAVARSLDVESSFFADRMRSPQCFIRMLRYPPVAPTNEAAVSTGSHTDYGVITLLATDGGPGLEVRRLDGSWSAVEAPRGAFVVNLGDMLARWTNDRYVSTPHRVVSTGGPERSSIPFFVNPDPDTIVSSIASCVTSDRSSRYEPIRAGDFLRGRIDGTIPERRF